MDLIGGYLLVILILFEANIALLLGNYELNKLKLAFISVLGFVGSFVLMYASNFISFVISDFSYVLFCIFIALVVILIYYFKNNDFKRTLYLITGVSVISVFFISSQSNLDMTLMTSYSLIVFISLFVVYQLSNLLHHAKRRYPVIVSEFMCLNTILMFIFALTYNSVITLNYLSYRAFLILTPAYKLIYAIIAIIVILIIGVFINDKMGENS